MYRKIKKHAKEVLELLTENLPDMLWIKDVDGKYIYANKAICDDLLMAKDPKEVVGKDDIFFAKRERELHKEEPEWHTFGELCFNSDLVVLENKKAMRFEEYGNVKGKLLYLEVFKAPIFDEAGVIIGTVGAGRDITELKNTQRSLENNLKLLEKQQEELEKFNETLEEKVQSEVEQRQDQERVLLHQSRQAAMGEMVEAIAHQWRQPLNNMGLVIANLETKLLLGDVKKEQLLLQLDSIAENIRYLSHTIDDFRGFLNPAADNFEATFSPKNTIEELLTIVNSQLKYTDISVATDIDISENIIFYGVENEFKQVLFILMNNAIDAIKNSANDIKAYDGKIYISLKVEQDRGVVKIIDNGGGVCETIQDRIFEPYFTTKHNSSGTGIGLYIAKNIITKRLDGKISCFNVKNGACFSLSIPIVKN